MYQTDFVRAKPSDESAQLPGYLQSVQTKLKLQQKQENKIVVNQAQKTQGEQKNTQIPEKLQSVNKDFAKKKTAVSFEMPEYFQADNILITKKTFRNPNFDSIPYGDPKRQQLRENKEKIGNLFLQEEYKIGENQKDWEKKIKHKRFEPVILKNCILDNQKEMKAPDTIEEKSLCHEKYQNINKNISNYFYRQNGPFSNTADNVFSQSKQFDRDLRNKQYQQEKEEFEKSQKEKEKTQKKQEESVVKDTLNYINKDIYMGGDNTTKSQFAKEIENINSQRQTRNLYRQSHTKQFSQSNLNKNISIEGEISDQNNIDNEQFDNYETNKEDFNTTRKTVQFVGNQEYINQQNQQKYKTHTEITNNNNNLQQQEQQNQQNNTNTNKYHINLQQKTEQDEQQQLESRQLIKTEKFTSYQNISPRISFIKKDYDNKYQNIEPVYLSPEEEQKLEKFFQNDPKYFNDLTHNINKTAIYKKLDSRQSLERKKNGNVYLNGTQNSSTLLKSGINLMTPNKNSQYLTQKQQQFNKKLQDYNIFTESGMSTQDNWNPIEGMDGFQKKLKLKLQNGSQTVKNLHSKKLDTNYSSSVQPSQRTKQYKKSVDAKLQPGSFSSHDHSQSLNIFSQRYKYDMHQNLSTKNTNTLKRNSILKKSDYSNK